MKHFATLLFALVACAAPVEDVQVDGQYRVSVVQTANTCNSLSVGGGAPGLTTRLDLFRRSDGLYDLHWVDGWVPEDFAFTAVDLGVDEVRHDLGGGSEAVGTVSAEGLELELVHRGVRETGETCERRLAIRGVKRPMFAPGSVDARYIVKVDHRGGVCPDGTSMPARGAWNMRMEVLPFRDDRTSVVIEDPEGGLLRFWIEPIDGGGAVRLTHDLFFAATDGHLTSLDGTVEGTIQPDGVALQAAIANAGDPDACVTSYAITGARWVPSATSVDAEYRATYRLTDTCDPSYEVVYEDVASVVAQAGDRLDLIDKEIQSTVGFDGANVSGLSPTYRGTVTPERVSYVVEDRYVYGGQTCSYKLEVDGTARY